MKKLLAHLRNHRELGFRPIDFKQRVFKDLNLLNFGPTLNNDRMTAKKRIAIFASGSGSNTINIIDYFGDHPHIEVAAVFSNRSKAGVLEKVKEKGVATYHFDKTKFYESYEVLNQLNTLSIDFLVLAGFLILVPEYLIKAFPGRIINIHPALLPDYGGKGMYGEAVHKAILANQETKTGITIHYVNPVYDAGQIIAQYEVGIDPDVETPAKLQAKVHELEHTYYPEVIESVVNALPKRSP